MYELLSNKTIVIYNEVITGSGDFFGAKKLIQAIGQEARGVTIHWLISSPKKRADVAEKIAQTLQDFSAGVRVTRRNLGRPLNVSSIESCDMILLYPTVHYLKIEDYKLLKSFAAPIIHQHEYDGMQLYQTLSYKSELASVNTTPCRDSPQIHT
jgi:hypothetical protein